MVLAALQPPGNNCWTYFLQPDGSKKWMIMGTGCMPVPAHPCAKTVPNAFCGPYCDGRGQQPSPTSAKPVWYANGVVSLGESDLSGDGFGFNWGHGRTWANNRGPEQSFGGNGWTNTAMPRLYRYVFSTDLVGLMTDSSTVYLFDRQTDGSFTTRHEIPVHLEYDGSAGQYVSTQPDGWTFRFWDFDSSRPAREQGRLVSATDPAGNTVEVYSVTSDEKIEEVRRSGGGVTESYLYAYGADGQIASVIQRRQPTGGSWSTVWEVEYTYYDGTEPYGNAGDLKLVEVKDGNDDVLDTTYYRYYTASDSGGYVGGLRFVFNPASYARLVADLGSDLSDLSDSEVSPYADNYFEYDDLRRVTTEVAQGAGCSVCTGGQGTFTYEYTTSGNPDGYNSWGTQTVETLPDGNQNVVYTNSFGQVMLKVYRDTTTEQEWGWFYRYDDAGRVVLAANPSAVTGYDDQYEDLLHDQSGDFEFLSDSEGLITTQEFGSSTTATSTTTGDVAGYLKRTAIQQGETGTSVPQEDRAYIMRTVDGVDLFFPASSAKFRNDNGTGGQTTSLTYTWQGSSAEPESVTVTLPIVTTGQNGPGTATSTTTVFDEFGRLVWTKDAGGFLSYIEYDDATGAVIKTIQDVDTDETGDFTGLPSGWETPAGGGLHLITESEVDALGRQTMVVYPNGRVDYLVYDDPGHEVRYYPGWDDTTDRPTGPTTVIREDRENGYTETLTMSAAPDVDDGRPTGAEDIDELQSLARSYRNEAGQVVATDAYFDLSGVSYTTSTSLGAEGTNFYRTEHTYDQQGRPNKVVSPEGTIYRTVYDGLGRKVSEWVGIDDEPEEGFWSPDNPAGMTKVREFEYDGGNVGDSNLTEMTEYPGLSAADRVTDTFYDWRNRAVAVKAGVQVSEGTGVNRPITYTDYDNLGQVTKTRMYDGDAVSISSTNGVPNAPSSSLLRAQSTASYDELRRAFRTEVYSVDPDDGTLSSDTLKSDVWFDARGQVIKTAAPGGLVQKMAYDGAGRVTVSYLTDGGSDSGYADADDVTGDAVLEQTEYTYDDSGNVLTVTTRQRFHDEADTGALGTPSSGVNARVYYSGNYYDLADRLIASVDVGTNEGSAWTRPGSVPTPDAETLVTSYTYAADAVQDVTLTGSPTGGTFTLTFDGQTTSAIAYDASAATVDAALEALSNIDAGEVSVVDAPGGGWEVRFTGDRAGSWQPELTGNGSGLTGGSSPSVAVTTVSLGGDAGRVAEVTDPLGRVGRTYYDALGRAVRTVENFVNGEVSDADDKTTEYAYNSVGMTSLTARLSGGGGQTTAWVYGVISGGGNGLDSNDLVGATRWPDPATGQASGSEEETVTLNALGQVVTSTDRNGTEHTLAYDVLGRVVSDAVTTLGAGVDDAVRRIETAYDAQGNAALVTSYDAASSGNVVNQLLREFNGLGQLVSEWQEHTGEVDTETAIDPYTSPVVQYAYSEMPGGANHSRLTGMTYPSGYVLTFNYSSGLNSSISRLSSLSDSSGTVETYSYLGLGTVVVRGHPQPQIDLSYLKQGMEGNGDAGDQYTGLDRFGRVVDQRWIDTGSGSATDRFEYGYDEGSNRLYRDNLVNTAFGELYGYDGLNQLAGFDRGTLNGTKDGISGSPSRTQDWDYDALGNWDSVTTDSSTQTRAHNAQNEITDISGATDPTYDDNGNMTTDETGKQFVYDPWNRLVEVQNSSSATLETFAYDGLNRRVSNTIGSDTSDLYYSDQWRVLEEQVEGDATTRYVWSPVYVNALVLRDRDTDANGTLDERLWSQQDANWNVTALVDGTGAVVERYAYDPFGALTVLDANWGVDTDGASDVGWVYLFQGGRRDAVTGNYHFQRRDDDPDQGRWTTPDPKGFTAGDNNFYRFVGNNSVLLTDPTGLFTWAFGSGGAPPVGAPGITPVRFGFGWIPACPCDENTIQLYIPAPGVEPAQGTPVTQPDKPSWVVTTFFHTGATRTYRFYYQGETSGNQCAYDSNGKLITGGGAAGTPDYIGPGQGFWGGVGHFFLDVAPFGQATLLPGVPAWIPYHLLGWTPVNAPGCDRNSYGLPSPLELLTPAGPLNILYGLPANYLIEEFEDLFL